MRLAVAAHYSRAVYGEHKMVVAQRRVVNKLVVGTLQKCGIHRKDGAEAL